MKPKTREQLLKDACEAYADLNIFEACVAVLEGGTVSAGAQPFDFRIIALCKRAEQQCLRRYDAARAALANRGAITQDKRGTS